MHPKMTVSSIVSAPFYFFFFSKGALLLESTSHVSQAIDDNAAQRQRYFYLYIRLDPHDSLIRTAAGERRKIIIRRATFLIGKYLTPFFPYWSCNETLVMNHLLSFRFCGIVNVFGSLQSKFKTKSLRM